MHYVPAYLRPISLLNTGLASHVEEKAADIESFQVRPDNIAIKQSDEVPIWRYVEDLQGKTVIEHGRRTKVDEEVTHPDRHWWIISDGLLEDINPPLREHADIFDLLLALNLCIDAPVAFSQSPGQTVGGAYRVHNGGLDYRDDLSYGNLPLALLTMNEIPREITVGDELEEVFEMVRIFRSESINSDADMDIRVGLHMYDDALTASFWTMMTNLFFVCENVLCSGRPSRPTTRIAEVTEMDEQEAQNWKKAVNRLKHPDKGDDVPSLFQNSELKIPMLRYMRRTVNTALKHTMRRRYRDAHNSE